jgi:hypothetical protein
VKRLQDLAILLVAAVPLLSTSCGNSDKIASVTVTAASSGTTAGSAGTINLQGLGGTLQLKVTTNYTSGKFVDETNYATFTVTPEGTLDDQVTPLPVPPLGVAINATGLLTAVDPGICTWVNAGTLTTPGWFFSGDYRIVANYRGFQSQPIFIPVSSSASSQNNAPAGQCGPTD